MLKNVYPTEFVPGQYQFLFSRMCKSGRIWDNFEGKLRSFFAVCFGYSLLEENLKKNEWQHFLRGCMGNWKWHDQLRAKNCTVKYKIRLQMGVQWMALLSMALICIQSIQSHRNARKRCKHRLIKLLIKSYQEFRKVILTSTFQSQREPGVFIGKQGFVL